MKPPIVLSVNAVWNFVNFRSGLLRRLVAEGYDVIAVAPPDAQVDRLRALGVRFVPIVIDRRGLSPIGDLVLLRRYRRILRDAAPVAFLGWTIKPNIWGTLAAHGLGIPTINNISGLGTAFMRAGPLQTVARLLYRMALRRSSTIFFQNPADRDTFVALGLAQPSQSVLLPGSGIDTAQFAPAADPGLPSGTALTFLMSARLLADKGVREYVAAARRLRLAGSRSRFQIMGALDPANRSAITAAELAAWLAEGIIEHIAHCDDVRPWIAKADCVVLPSYREGMPRSLLEGAAMGKPLIATDIAGCVQIAREGENAIICRVKDDVDLGRAMAAMEALPPAMRVAMGATGRHIVEREFDEAIVIDRYLAALRRAIEQPT